VVENALQEVFRANILGFRLVRQDDAMAQDVVADRFLRLAV